MVVLPEPEAPAVSIPPDVTHRLAAQQERELRAEAREHRLAVAATPAPGPRRPLGLRPWGARLLLRLAQRLDAATVTTAVPTAGAHRR